MPNYPYENYGMPPVGAPPVAPRYEENTDLVDSPRGSIIKDLTDTEAMLLNYELSLCGLMINEEGKIVKNPEIDPRITDRRVAKEFVDTIRSIANQNTHFSGFEDKDVGNSLMALNYTINRWMMFQSGKIPRLYRQKLSLEAMNLTKASLMKARKALILQWSKGTIREGRTEHYSPNEKKGMFDWLMPKRNR